MASKKAKSGYSITPQAVQTIKNLRKQARLNQHEFWKLCGVTQSGGSRYESGRRIPKPVQMVIGAIFQGKPLPTVELTPVSKPRPKKAKAETASA